MSDCDGDVTGAAVCSRSKQVLKAPVVEEQGFRKLFVHRVHLVAKEIR